jgi:hypothetical protein
MAYLYLAHGLTFGTLGSPKSGFLPTLAGTITLVFSLILLCRQSHFREKKAQLPVDWTKFLFIIIGLLFYIIILNSIGYFFATFILLFYFFKLGDTVGWVFPLVISLCSCAVFYLLFSYYLKVTLP